MIRKNKKFIDPRYFMDEKMESQKCPPGERWEGHETGEGACVPLNEAHTAEHPGSCDITHPGKSHGEWKAAETQKK